METEFDNYLSDSNVFGYLVEGTNITQQVVSKSIITSLKNTARPDNIGRGTWSKQVASYTDDVLKFQKIGGKILDKVA